MYVYCLTAHVISYSTALSRCSNFLMYNCVQMKALTANISTYWTCKQLCKLKHEVNLLMTCRRLMDQLLLLPIWSSGINWEVDKTPISLSAGQPPPPPQSSPYVVQRLTNGVWIDNPLYNLLGQWYQATNGFIPITAGKFENILTLPNKMQFTSNGIKMSVGFTICINVSNSKLIHSSLSFFEENNATDIRSWVYQRATASSTLLVLKM